MLTAKPLHVADQLPPLSEKAQRACEESLAYAIDHDLFLHLLTDEHLQYHHDVVREEYARIPYADKEPDASHLPVFEIPPVSITDSWTVHQRVASVLESACRWLSDEELEQHEEAVAIRQQRQAPQTQKFDVNKLKLECPLIGSDHDEDCAELRRIVAQYHRYDGRRLDHQQDNTNVDSGISDVLEICGEGIETMLRSEAIAVDKRTIDCLTTHIASMGQDVDTEEFILSASIMPEARCRRLPSPLPPVLYIDEYMPEGDVCCISEPSEPSSSIGEYAEAAARDIPTRNTADFVEAKESLEPYILRTAILADSLIQDFDEIGSLEFLHKQAEDSLTVLKLTLFEKEDEVLQTTEGDDMVFADWIAESVWSNASDKPQEAAETQKTDQTDAVATAKSQSGDEDNEFQTVTEDLLLAMEEDDTAKQAKIPVPDIGPSKYLPEWHDIASNPAKLLQWIMTHEMETPTFEELDSLEPCQFETSIEELDSRNVYVSDKELGPAGDRVMEKVTSWMETEEPETWSLMFDPTAEAELFFNRDQKEEEKLEILQSPQTQKNNPVRGKPGAEPSNVDSRQQRNGIEPSPQEPISPMPPKTKNHTSGTWGDLMDRFKKRQTDSASTPSMDDNCSSCNITAPELLIGSRAFESAFISEQKKYATGEQSTADCPEIEEEDTDISESDMPIVNPENLPQVILSTAVPRAIRTQVFKLLLDLNFVERDYNLHTDTTSDIDTNDEADIVMSPRSGIIFTTMVGLRQMDSQRRPLFQSRLIKTSKKYDTLHVLVYRNGSIISRASTADNSLDISPSDALAFSQLLGFTKTLLCDTRVAYISGGETAVAKFAAKLISTGRTRECTISESYLEEEATREERVLRQGGLNVYDAQIAIGMARKQNANGSADILQSLMEEDSGNPLGDVVVCRRALDSAKQLLTLNIQ